MTISELIADVHETAKSKGWWDDGVNLHDIPGLLMLIVSEASEALEDYRDAPKGEAFEWLRTIRYDDKGKPIGFAIEMADIVIRVFDLCRGFTIPLVEAIRIKAAYNKTRAFRHGGKRA